jgi:hypothetical protein
VHPAARGTGGASDLPEPGVLGDLAQDLTAAALAGRSADPGVRGLVGVGRGLTPSGDDALCGVLLTLAAIDAPEVRHARAAVVAAVRGALSRTTSLSAALLVAAGEGYAVPDVARLVTLVAGAGPLGRSDRAEPTPGASSAGSIRPVGPTPETCDLTDLTERVLAIGHSSGRDLLSGVSGALRALDALHDAHQSTSRQHPHEGAHRG